MVCLTHRHRKKNRSDKWNSASLWGEESVEYLKKIHSTPNDKKGQGEEITVTAGMIESVLAMDKKQR